MNSQQLFPQSTAVIDNDNGSTNSDSVENTKMPSIISNNIQSGRNCYFTDISIREYRSQNDVLNGKRFFLPKLISVQENIESDDDLKTPTVEELSFPGSTEAQQKAVS